MTVDDGTERRFDTNDGYFHKIKPINGSRLFAARSVSINYNTERAAIDTTKDYNIGAVPDACDAILGSIRCTYGSNAVGGLTDTAYFSIFGGGTYVHVFDGYQFRDGRGRVEQIVHYTFTVQGGSGAKYVRLRERFFIRLAYPSPPAGSYGTYGVDAFTMHWRLRVGRFT